MEILEEIYLYSENPSFALVNKQFAQCLSSQSIRLRFCVRLFSYGCYPREPEDEEIFENLGRTQTLLLQQPWFSNNLARKVQRQLLQPRKAQEEISGVPQEHSFEGPQYHPRRLVRAALWTEIPKQLLLQKPWGKANVRLIHRLLKWGARIPRKPEYIAFDAMMNAIIEQKYLAVNLLHNYGYVGFHHKHFQAAVLHGCDKKIVEMIVEANNQQQTPFIDPFDRLIYNRAMAMEEAGNPMGQKLLREVLGRGNEQDSTVASW